MSCFLCRECRLETDEPELKLVDPDPQCCLEREFPEALNLNSEQRIAND